jgi:hypothetical protein
MPKKLLLSFLTVVIASFLIVFAVRAALPTVSSGQTLTAANWNALVSNVNQLGPGTASVAQNGYVHLPGGLIMQWGRLGNGTNNSVPYAFNVTFPVPFPNNVFNIQMTPSEEVSLAVTVMLQLTSKNLTGFVGRSVNSGNSTSPVDYVYWVAIGN